MKLAFITPTAYLEKFSSQGDIFLALAHLIDDEGNNEYARFHRRMSEQGRRVILDNGLFEGAQVSTDQLLQRARVIDAQCVCAPDALFDSKGTIKLFKEFIRAKHDAGLVCEVMGIPQANTPTEWWECFQFMQAQSDCDMLGLSILSIPHAFADAAEANDRHRITDSRVHVLRQLYALSYLADTRLKPMHLLGLGESYADVIVADYLLPRDVVSNDSSSAFVHGYAGVRYAQNGLIPGGKIKAKLNFDVPPPTGTYEWPEIQHNIDVAKRLANASISI